MADEGFCYKIIGNYIVGYSTEGDGLYEFGTERCPKDNRHVCREIKIDTRKVTSYDSGHYKKELVKKNISKILVSIKWKK